MERLLDEHRLDQTRVSTYTYIVHQSRYLEGMGCSEMDRFGQAQGLIQ